MFVFRWTVNSAATAVFDNKEPASRICRTAPGQEQQGYRGRNGCIQGARDTQLSLSHTFFSPKKKFFLAIVFFPLSLLGWVRLGERPWFVQREEFFYGFYGWEKSARKGKFASEVEFPSLAKKKKNWKLFVGQRLPVPSTYLCPPLPHSSYAKSVPCTQKYVFVLCLIWFPP